MDVDDSSSRLTRRKIPSRAAIERSKSLPAWALSVLLHTGILVTLALLWTSRPHGTSREAGGPIGIAVVHQQHGVEEYMLADDPTPDESSGDSNQATESPLTGLPSAQDARDAQSELLRSLLPQLDSGGGTQATGDTGLGGGNTSLPTGNKSGGVKAKLFGIEGEGSRFVYVIDRSESMDGFEGKPMQKARTELIESLTTLGPTHQFQIIFYSDTPMPYGGATGSGPELLRGDDRTKELVKRFIRDIPAIGGTNHVDALRMALSMGPDILFFLTDGDYPQPARGAVENILERASRFGTTIHCIQFGEGNRSELSNWISNLAQASGGQFRYVDVSEL